MNPEESFGRFIKARRRALDLTQEELARRVGCAAVTLRKIEADDLRPSQQIAERMAMALGIPLDERAAFVRQARAVTPKTGRPIEPTPTPMPRPEEIGQEDLSGRAIRGYALGERIGAGGMGAVYRAVQPLVEREVAIKIILPQFANHPDFIRRFEAEAQLVARLEHPHIVPLYDYWREPGVAYLVMRLLRGGSVRTLLESGALPLEAVARLLEQIGTALHAAHRVGVIHRDLKPANVLLDEDGNAYLADFGIAKNLGNPNMEDVTHADAIVGSPAYMSPEQIRSDTIRPQTDIYCLGVMLYELLTGNAPFHGPTPFDLIQQHLSVPLPPLAARRPGLPAALDMVILRATAKDPAERYESVSELVTDFKAAISGSLSSQPIPTLIMDDQLLMIENPYKGLRAFGEGDAEDFFGRETLTQQLLARLAEGGDLARFLAVVGPSGSGKSSVVGAGLVPALRRGALPGSENWFIVELMPGPHPLEELEAALLRIAVSPPTESTLLAQLREDERGLLRAVRRCLPDDPNIELVLVIDQFEEVFTLVHDEAIRAHLLNSLLAAVLDERSRVRVVITLRADFTDRPLRYMDFGELMRQRSEFVLPLTPDELEHAIRNPATRVGLTLEPGLAAAIIHDVADQPGALPLLQYALTELFEKREGRTLTKKAYIEIGGVLGALGRRAEEVFASLDTDGQALARQLFLRLVTLGEGVEDTRRRVLRSELESLVDVMLSEAKHPAVETETLRFAQGDKRQHVMEAVLEAFGKHRLLSFDRDPVTRGPTVEVAHEALLREWPRLREWLNESRADVRLQRQLATAAAEWQSANRESSFLLTGARLEQFAGWALNTTVALTADEHAYLDAGIADRETRETTEQARQKRELDDAKRIAEAARKLADTERQSVTRLRLRNRVITAVGAVAVVLAVLAGLFGLQSNQNATRAEQNLGAAQIANTQSAANAAAAQAASTLALENANAAQNAQATAQAASTQAIDNAASAEAERLRAEEEKRLATSRELAAAALANLTKDPERSILLALQAVSKTYPIDNLVLPEAEESLRRSLHAMRLQLSILGSVGPVRAQTEQPKFVGLPGTHQSELGCPSDWPPDCALTALTYDEEDGVWQGAFLIQPGNDQDKKGPRYKVALDKTWDVNYGFNAQADGADIPLVVDTPTQVKFYFDNATHWVTDNHNSVIATLVGDFQQALGCKQNDDPGCLRSWLEDPDGDGTYVFSTANLPAGQYLVRVAINENLAEVYGQDGVPGGAPISFNVLQAGQDLYFGYDAKSHKLLVSSEASGHIDNSKVFAAAFSPDGTRLATASDDRTAKLWNVATGDELLILRGHEDAVTYVAFSPDGTHLATASLDGSGKVWDIATGAELLSLRGHTSAVNSIAYSPDGKLLATASDDSTAKVWDAHTGKELLTLNGHTWLVVGVAFSSNGTRVATAGFDDTARVWDVATGKELLTLQHANFVDSVAFSPDGQRLATANQDGIARIWDATSGQQLLALYGHNGIVNSVDFSPDGARLATCGADAVAKIWDAGTGQELITLSGHTSQCRTVAFNSDGKRLVTASDDGMAKVWDISREGSREWFTLANHTSGVMAAEFSSDGKYIATGSWDGTAKIWDANTGQELLTVNHPPRIRSISFNPDGTRLATTSDDGVARVWDVTSGLNVFDLIGHTHSVLTSIAFSPDGKRIVTGSWDNTAKVWDATTGQELFTLYGHGNWVRDVAFSPDEKYIVTTSADRTAKLWDADTGIQLRSFSGFRDEPTRVAFNPNGTHLAITSYDGTATVWDVRSSTLLFTLSGHLGGALGVAFSPDGKLLAVGSVDGNVHIWNATTGEALFIIPGGAGVVYSVAFSPDQIRLVTGNDDGTARVYALRIEDLIALAQVRVTRSLTVEECKQYLHVTTCP